MGDLHHYGNRLLLRKRFPEFATRITRLQPTQFRTSVQSSKGVKAQPSDPYHHRDIAAFIKMPSLELIWNYLDKLVGNSKMGNTINRGMRFDSDHPRVGRLLDAIAISLEKSAELDQHSLDRKKKRSREHDLRRQQRGYSAEAPQLDPYEEQRGNYGEPHETRGACMQKTLDVSYSPIG